MRILKSISLAMGAAAAFVTLAGVAQATPTFAAAPSGANIDNTVAAAPRARSDAMTWHADMNCEFRAAFAATPGNPTATDRLTAGWRLTANPQPAFHWEKMYEETTPS